jgi:hypothetical protein
VVRLKAFKLEIIVNSFASASIVLFNLEYIISKLNILLITPPRPISGGSDSSRNFTLKTPYTVKEVKR